MVVEPTKSHSIPRNVLVGRVVAVGRWMGPVVKSSLSLNSYSRMFFNEVIEEDLVYSIISFILNTSRMCKLHRYLGPTMFP